jgi:hypothetical protein
VTIRVRVISDVRGQVEGLVDAVAEADRLIVLGNLTDPPLDGDAALRGHERVLAALPVGAVIGIGLHGGAELSAPPRSRGPRLVDAGSVRIGAWTFGFVGGSAQEGLESGLDAKLERLGPVDVICTPVPPRLPTYTYDVAQRTFLEGSTGLVAYLRRHAPRWALFGHVRSPLMPRGTIGATELVNVAHLHAMGSAFILDVPE